MTVFLLFLILGFGGYILFFRFSFQKNRLESLYSSLLSDMNVDFQDNAMAPQNLANIAISLENFIAEIESIVPHFHTLSDENQKYVFDTLRSFQNDLSLWLSRHQSEITLLEKSIAHYSDDGEHSLFALEKRLETHANAIQMLVS